MTSPSTGMLLQYFFLIVQMVRLGECFDQILSKFFKIIFVL